MIFRPKIKMFDSKIMIFGSKIVIFGLKNHDLLLFSFNILLIGMIGEYITRIYDEVKIRPNYIIEDIVEKKD